MKQLTQKQIETFKNLAKKKTSKEISPDDWSVYKISEGNFDDAYWIGCNDSEIETARFILNLLNIEYKQETFGSKKSGEVELPKQDVDKLGYDVEACISCDDEKSTYNICMDCVGEMIKNDALAFLKWIGGSYSFGNVLGKWYLHENTNKQYTEDELFEMFKSFKQTKTKQL